MDKKQSFIRGLQQYIDVLPKQAISTIRGQAIAGDLQGARKGLRTVLLRYKKIIRKYAFTKAHENTRYSRAHGTMPTSYRDEFNRHLSMIYEAFYGLAEDTA